MPDLRYEIEDVVATRERVVIPYTLRAKVNGREIAVRGVMRFVVDAAGLITQRIDYWDSEVFRRLTGGFPCRMGRTKPSGTTKTSDGCGQVRPRTKGWARARGWRVWRAKAAVTARATM
jgi:hypothetical protein